MKSGITQDQFKRALNIAIFSYFGKFGGSISPTIRNKAILKQIERDTQKYAEFLVPEGSKVIDALDIQSILLCKNIITTTANWVHVNAHSDSEEELTLANNQMFSALSLLTPELRDRVTNMVS